MKKLYLLILCAVSLGYSQSSSLKVGSNPYTIKSSAVLEVENTSKGFLPPRMTESQKNAIVSPALGLMLYCTDCGLGELQVYNGTAWVNVVGKVAAKFVPTITSVTTGKVWMDRNLGATQAATSETDAAAYGDLYQWGRGTDGHQLSTSSVTTTLATSATAAGPNFINSGQTNWLITSRDDLWQGVDGVNNPCPEGFRIPTIADFTAENITGKSHAFSTLKFVGNFSRASNALTVTVCTYWTSTLFSSPPFVLYFKIDINSVTSTAGDYRYIGHSVRCIKG